MEVKYRIGRIFMADDTYIDLYSVDDVEVWDKEVEYEILEQFPYTFDGGKRDLMDFLLCLFWDVSVSNFYNDSSFDNYWSSGYANLTEDELIGCLKKNDVIVSEFLGG